MQFRITTNKRFFLFLHYFTSHFLLVSFCFNVYFQSSSQHILSSPPFQNTKLRVPSCREHECLCRCSYLVLYNL
uniref:Uncharacterized protein n=1 Tax=Rhizophora mucronata TaxID=61149 RepID=A0A2P2JHY3_RHIMU